MSPITSTTAVQKDQDHENPKNAGITLRSYQTRIVDKVLQENTIVVLPTGAGKTLIAAEVILRHGSPALFLVPTVMLVEQQEAALRGWTQLDVKPYSGGVRLPSTFQVLVSTPKAFEDAQLCNENLHWEKFKTIVFDEVHHVLREHPYRMLACSLHRAEARPRVLGLTASYTYAIGENQVKFTLQRMCDELKITNLETASYEELRSSGYHAAEIKAETPHADLQHDVPAGVLPPEKRRPHLMMRMFFDRVLEQTATPFARSLTKCVLHLEVMMARMDPTFPKLIQCDFPMKQWSVYAHRHADINSGGQQVLFQQLEQWYEAMRILIVSWEEDEYASVYFLRMFKCDTNESISAWPKPTADVIRKFWKEAPSKFSRLDSLKTVLLQKHKHLDSFRGILFVQQRTTTHILEHFIANDPVLSKKFSTASLYSASSPATPSLSVTRAQGRERMQQFSREAINLLITTVVAEEGMDVPSANCVIRFDPMHHAVSLVQGRGRARQENSSFVVLQERPDRPTHKLAAVEKQQIDLIRNFKPMPSSEAGSKDMQAQRSREIAASLVLAGTFDQTNSLLKLNEFCVKTKVALQKKFVPHHTGFAVQMRYVSLLRSVSAEGCARNKKWAMAVAAAKILLQLQKQILGESWS